MQIMRNIVKSAALAAALGIGAIATAQSSLAPASDYYPYNFTLRGGVCLPIDSSTSDAIGSSLIALGIDYRCGESLFKGGETYFSLEYMAKSFRGERGTIMPLTINQKFYTNSNSNKKTYAILGAGVAFLDITSQNTAVAGRAGVGVELSDNVISEIIATISDKAGGGSANSIAFYFGYRF